MISPERLDEVARALEAALEHEVGCTVVTKEESYLHVSIAAAFDAARGVVAKVRELAPFLSAAVPPLGLPTGAEYLADFATTIGNEIALPRAWRLPGGALERLLVLPHEATHVTQHQKGVDLGWWPKAVSHSVLYLASIAGGDGAEYVGHVEGDAYAVTECVRGWLSPGSRRSADEVAESLRRHYALAGVGTDVAIASLRSHYKTMDDGGVPNVRLARWTISWLNAHAADLRGQVPA